jgi:hypothetical protein
MFGRRISGDSRKQELGADTPVIAIFGSHRKRKATRRKPLPFQISLPFHAFLRDATSESYNKDPSLTLVKNISFTLKLYPGSIGEVNDESPAVVYSPGVGGEIP